MNALLDRQTAEDVPRVFRDMTKPRDLTNHTNSIPQNTVLGFKLEWWEPTLLQRKHWQICATNTTISRKGLECCVYGTCLVKFIVVEIALAQIRNCGTEEWFKIDG